MDLIMAVWKQKKEEEEKLLALCCLILASYKTLTEVLPYWVLLSNLYQ